MHLVNVNFDAKVMQQPKQHACFLKYSKKIVNLKNKFIEALAEAQGPLLVHIPNKTVHSGKFVNCCLSKHDISSLQPVHVEFSYFWLITELNV